MTRSRSLFAAFALALLAGSATASPSTDHGSLLPVPANHIVGAWQVAVTLAPCAGGPSRTFLALNTFQAGGTMSDTNAAPPSTRGPGQGIWRYRGQGHYATRFQFFRYLPDGSFDGVTDVSTETTVTGGSLESEVRGRLLNPDGSVRMELCGNAVGERVDFD